MGVDQTELEVPGDAVGRRVSCGEERATVRYVGPVPPTAGLWLGVEWDNPERGKHDGSHEGVQYFACRNPKGGSFVRPAKVSFGVDFLSAVRQVYQINAEEVLSEEISISSKKLTWEGVQERSFDTSCVCQMFLFTLSVSLLPLNISHALCFSNNRLCLTSDPAAHSQAFCSLRVLALNSCDLTWPQVRPMVLSKLGLFNFQNKSTAGSTLSLSQWAVVDELAKLPGLVQFSCRGNRLVSSDGNPKTANQMLIAKLGRLVVLNSCEIYPEDRRGAELDYIKMFGEEWLKSGGRSQSNTQFTCQHPRYQSLIDKYGAPEEGELKKPQPFALKNQLLRITFVFPDDADRKPIEKKLPASMGVQKVKGLLYRLLKVPAADLRLSYTSPKMVGTEFEIESDLKTLQFYSIEDGDQVLVRWT
uniref:Tubulin-specific chaperone E n=1 Tax=Mastacembelus armatus TaxID=205130 RepID=A0A7N9AR12_9TELE